MKTKLLFSVLCVLAIAFSACKPTNVPDDKNKTEAEAVDLGLPSGLKWANMNIGATAPEEYGDYFAWGETTPKKSYNWDTHLYCQGSLSTITKYCTTSDYGTVDGKTTLEPKDDAAQANWGGAWRMPTKEEMWELCDNCTWTKGTLNGVEGHYVTGKNGNSIFMPNAGYYIDSEIHSESAEGYYWSSTLGSDNSTLAFNFQIGEGMVIVNDYDRAYGRSVRAVAP